MSFTKKNLVLFSFILFAFTACNLNFLAHKSGQLFFDFSSFAPEKNSNSRSAIEDYVEDGKDYYIDLTIDGSYKFSATIDLKDVNTYTIDNIPVGTRIKAKIDFYTYNIPGDLYSRETLLSGESKYYTITAGVNEIVINLKSEFIKLYVTKNESIQDKIDWIAQHGNSEKDYKIILTGYEDEPFNESLDFKTDLNNRAKSITLTSSNPNKVALKGAIHSTEGSSIVVSTYINVIFENIQISPDCNFAILQTNSDSNVTLGKGTLFKDNKSHNYAIRMEGGSLHMKGNSCIDGFSASDGGAVYINKGYFYMDENSRIQNCEATSYGGAIYVYSYAVLCEINDKAKIYNCNAANGGAISTRNQNIYINGGSITNCTASSCGGAIYTDKTNYKPVIYIRGGEIKDNKANMGSAIYLADDINSQVIMYENACIDISNDIYSHYQQIRLASPLKTLGKAAVITFNSFSENQLVIGNYDNSDAVSKSYNKFYLNQADTSATGHYKLNNDGCATLIENLFTSSSDPVQLGDIVFADNSRMRPEKFDYDNIDYNLLSSIAGIVFYAGGGSLGNVNLIVGTETYRDIFENSRHGNASYTMFDLTQVSNFPKKEQSPYPVYIYTESINIADAEFDGTLNTGNSRFDNTSDEPHNDNVKDTVQSIFAYIQSAQTNPNANKNDFALYQDILQYGQKFNSSSNYTLNMTEANIKNNWYIPTIAEYILFYNALKSEDKTFYNIYTEICGEPKDEYISASVLKSGGVYPDSYSGTNDYAYQFTIDLSSETIKCAHVGNYLWTIPVHIYEQ